MPRRRLRQTHRTPARSSKGARVPKRTRAKIRSRFKRHYRLTRREIGAIGAGHLEAPEGYLINLAGALELARFRKLAP